MYQKNKASNESFAGGVAILVPDSWMVFDPKTYDDTQLEAKSLVIFPPQCEPIKVATIYNHPGDITPDLFFTCYKEISYNGRKIKGSMHLMTILDPGSQMHLDKASSIKLTNLTLLF